MTQNVYFLNRYYEPDTCATAQLLGNLSRALSKDGAFEITVVCGRGGYLDPMAKRQRMEKMNGIKVRRLLSTRFGRSRMMGRLLDYATLHFSTLFYLLVVVRSKDIVVVTTDPPLWSVTVSIVRLLRSFHYVAWCQDLFPEIAMVALKDTCSKPSETGIWRRQFVEVGQAIFQALRVPRDWSLRSADFVVSISTAMWETLEQRGVSQKRLHLIENWAVQSTGEESQADQLRESWNLGEADFIIGHFGNLGRSHDYDTVLKCAEKLATETHLRWLFVGSGYGYEKVRNTARNRDWCNFRFSPYLGLDELAHGLRVPDLHWFSLRKEMEPYLLPSKFYGILKAGKPVLMIGEPQGELGRLITEEGIGYVIKEGDSDALAELISGLLMDRSPLVEMANRARDLHHYSFEEGIAHRKWGCLLKSFSKAMP